MSQFRGTLFDWEFSNPKRSIQDGAFHLTGSVIFYSQTALDQMFRYVRPCTVRVAGDPFAGGLVYVDHWGPDPSGDLDMTYLDVGPPLPPPFDNATNWQPTPVTYKAILTSLSRNEALPNGVHKADADFLLLMDEVADVPGLTGSSRTGQTGSDTGAPPVDTGPPVGGGGVVRSVMGTNTSDTNAYSLWDDSLGENVPPPDQWEQPYTDATGWSNSVIAAGASGIWATTDGVWASTDPLADGEEVLFRQSFSVDEGTILSGVLRTSFNEHLTGVWINGNELEGTVGLGVAVPLFVDPAWLLQGEENVFAASCVSRGTEPAWVDFRLDLTYSEAG